MLSVNNLYEIFSYLQLQDLIQIQSVSKSFYKAASIPALYKSEFTRIYLGSRRSENTVSQIWKILSIQMLHQERTFIRISEKDFPSFSCFINNIIEILSNPEIPLPQLRRENQIFPTIIQDMLGNINDRNISFSENGLVSDPNILKKSLIPVSSTLTKLINCFCDGVFLKISESPDVFQEYLSSWENYTFSIKNLSDFFEPFIEKMEEFGILLNLEKKFCLNVCGYMIKVWKQKVFYKLANELNKEFLKYFEEVYRGSDVNEWEMCYRFVESLVDISVNKYSIHLKKHSLSEYEGPIKMLERQVIEHLKGKRVLSEQAFKSVNEVFKLFPTNITNKILDVLCLDQDWPEDYTEYMANVQYQDLIIESFANRMQIFDQGSSSRCKLLETFDIFPCCSILVS